MTRIAIPELLTQLPRYPLLYPTPSPIHPLHNLTASLNNSKTLTRYNIHAKREDHSSPLACAGNKYRKLEYIVPEILSIGSRHGERPITTLVTEGAIQSNHTVQVAALARKLGLKAVVLLGKDVGGGYDAASNKAAFLRTGNAQMVDLLGAEIHFLDRAPTEEDPTPRNEMLKDLKRRGENPYFIPSGASRHPLGGVGYARCAFEIAMQEQTAKLPGSGRFDYIFAACGSGSTVAGLIAGFKMVEKLEQMEADRASQGASQKEDRKLLPPRKVVGVLTSPTKPRLHHLHRVQAFGREAAVRIGLDPVEMRRQDIRLDNRFVGDAYGVLDRETNRKLQRAVRSEGIMLDPVYTAKVISSVRSSIRYGQSDLPSPYDQANLLFLHTGGQAALPAYEEFTKIKSVFERLDSSGRWNDAAVAD